MATSRRCALMHSISPVMAQPTREQVRLLTFAHGGTNAISYQRFDLGGGGPKIDRLAGG
jgi:hypothetical protein